MMRRCLSAVLAAASGLPLQAQDPPGFTMETFVTGLDLASAMAFAPDGRLFVLERGSGTVRYVRDGVLSAPWATIATTGAVGEGGLLGIAIDPDFTTTAYVYCLYTRSIAGRWETVIERRLEVAGVGVQPQPIGPTLFAGGRHCGGPLLFGRDGTLFAVLGEGGLELLSQSLAHPNGKVLRLLVPGGAAPSDNPFVGTAGASPYVFAWGIRNSFGLALHPSTGELYETENTAAGGDELNRILAGRNYGWPIHDGRELVQDPATEDPLWTQPPDPALTGADFATGPHLPPALRSALIAAAYNDGTLRAFDIDAATGTVRGHSIFATHGATFGVLDGPDGAIYALVHPSRFERGADRIVRYVPIAAPSPALQMKAVSNVALGGSLTFGVTANAGEIAFAWAAPGPNPQPVPTPFGDLIVPIVLPLPVLAIGADRRGYLALALPDDPTLRGVTVYAQCAAIAGPALRIGGMAAYVLR